MAERSPPGRWRDTHYTGAGLIDLPINYALQLPKKTPNSRAAQNLPKHYQFVRATAKTLCPTAPGIRHAQYCMQASQFLARGHVLARQPCDGSKKK